MDDKKGLSEEEKKYIMQLATSGTLNDVKILDKIRLEFLNGKTIEDVESTYFGNEDKLTSPKMKEDKPEKEPAENIVCAEKTEEIREEPYSDKKNPNQMARAEPEAEENLQETELQEQSKEQELTDENMAYSEPTVLEEPDRLAPSEKEDSIPVQKEKEESQNRMEEEIKALKEEITKVKEKNKQIEESMEKWKREVLGMQKPGKDVVAVPKPSKPSKRKWFHFWQAKSKSHNYIIRLLSNPKFTTEQIMEIRLAVEADLDEMQIKSFAKAEVPARQMREIRLLYETQNKKIKGMR
ncbi:MAG: hypothetical protein K2N51_08860 [Lachnospiraceae bacterium]|nr:hypothetical protein [Lachnospiraceae bacterium]